MIYAINGIRYALRGSNLRIMVIISVAVGIISALLGISYIEWGLIIICIAISLSAEIMNSAIETLCDLVNPSYDKKIGIIKDLAAGSVLILSIGSAIIGVIILGPQIWSLLSL